ncbi:ABC-2 family transporter protein [Nakamurella panacisegetis]|uniref:ABC-2 family transporter protein n=1 Tax=Nakamurella panacisegetis TaxID=1090615 RepID=A0A1H0RD28_9ACTN|nr:ABC transporter permease [Nakamurella panacisegetis]SDP27437.1 ABC-2 family transporter protein [Nakamurella panacisegetis]
MTTTHDQPTRAPQRYTPQANPAPVTLPRVLSSEWVKLRSLRSSWITMILAVAGLVVVAIAGGILTNQDWSHMRPRELARFEPIGQSLTGINFSQLAIGVLGVLFITGEYGTGMIRSSLAAAPRRLPVLWAKAILFATVTFVLMELSAFLAFLTGQAALASHGTTLAAAGALRATVGTGLYLTVVALLGVGLGFIIRSTAGGIAALFGLLLVLPGILAILPQTWQDNIGPYLPSNAGAAIYTVKPDTTSLSPWTGFAVFCLYAAVALGVAALVLKRRDA